MTGTRRFKEPDGRSHPATKIRGHCLASNCRVDETLWRSWKKQRESVVGSILDSSVAYLLTVTAKQR